MKLTQQTAPAGPETRREFLRQAAAAGAVAASARLLKTPLYGQSTAPSPGRVIGANDRPPHKLHPYLLATGRPEFPSRVACVGTRKIETDRNTPGTPMRDVPEIVQLIAEFPSGMVMHITSSSVNEFGTQEAIRGHKANLVMAGNKVELRPERPFTDDLDPETSPAFPAESIEAHHKDFFDSIRAQRQPNCGIDLALRVQTIVSLAEMSQRLNVLCCFDEAARKITTAEGREL